jgi:hypothetical protein
MIGRKRSREASYVAVRMSLPSGHHLGPDGRIGATQPPAAVLCCCARGPSVSLLKSNVVLGSINISPDKSVLAMVQQESLARAASRTLGLLLCHASPLRVIKRTAALPIQREDVE